MPGNAAFPFDSDVDFKGNEGLNLRLHQITGLSDLSTPVDGQVAYITTTNAKRISFYNGDTSGLTWVPRLDLDEIVTGQWSFAPGSVRAPFALGLNAIGQTVTGLSAQYLGGYAPDAAANPNTIVLRDASGRLKCATPAADDDATNRKWVYDTMYGIVGTKVECRVMATGNVNISSAPVANDAVWDGVTLSAGDRVFLASQTTGSENGSYNWNGAAVAMTRTTDADTSSEVFPGMTYFVSEGTTLGNTRWQLITNDPITLDTTALTFAQIPGVSDILVGSGMGKDNTTLFVKVGTAGTPAGSSYTAGALVYCDTASTLNAASIDGMVRGNGASAPSAVTGSAGYFPTWSSDGKALSGTAPLYYSGTGICVATTTSHGTFTVSSGGDQISSVIPDETGYSSIYCRNAAGTNVLGLYYIGTGRSGLYGIPVGGAGIVTVGTGIDLNFGTLGSLRWTITAAAGLLQSNGPQTIQTSTGNLTLATAAGNGNILLMPNGTGRVGVGVTGPAAGLHVQAATGLAGRFDAVSPTGYSAIFELWASTPSAGSTYQRLGGYYANTSGTSLAAFGFFADNSLDFGIMTGGHINWTFLSSGVLQGSKNLYLVSTSSAALNSQVCSPTLHFEGQGWDSTNSLSKAVDFNVYVQPVQGPGAPTANLIINSSIAGAGYVNPLAYSSDGVLSVRGKNVARIYAATLSTSVTQTVTHGLSTFHVFAFIRDTTSQFLGLTQLKVVDADNVEVRLNTAPAAGEKEIIIVGY